MARAAAAVLAVQAVLLGAASVLLAVEGFRPGTVDRLGAEILALIGLVSAAGGLALARAIDRGRYGARSPVVVIELICLPIAYTIVQNDHLLPGIALGLSAIVVLGLLAASGQLTQTDD